MSLDDQPTLVHDVAGERCATCASPLASDQRYCLECGTRRGGPRVPVAAAGAGVAGSVSPAGYVAGVAAAPPTLVERFGGTWGVAALLLVALAVGVVIGDVGDDPAPVDTKPPVVTIAAAGLATGPAAAAAPVTASTPARDEWPARDGFTVQLGELDKAGTDQAAADAAKAAAAAKGVPAPGVLDAGAHGLTDGKLVLYSGVFSKRADATSALDAVKASYPEARVIEVEATGAGAEPVAADDGDADAGSGSTVSKSELESAEKLSPEAFQEKSKKAPKTQVLGGEPPPTDDKPAGDGSDAETIG